VEPEWSRVKELFWAALERAPDQRYAFLRDACGGNQSLRTEVESLLAANEQPASVLQRPLPLPDSPLLAFTAFPGLRLGAYELIREIGHGGMATVYLALRADGQYRKRVAIKLVRHHAHADEIQRRFRTERQALAALDHPNIVRLLDGGSTEDGLPYLVMDYVEGLPIDQYCDSHNLSVTQRLDLFRTVCAAVQYAHEQLVIHRDLKPGNILVSAEGTPKLMDFGIAKVLDPEFSAETLLVTRADVHPMTPLYASPEQVRGGPITAATDIYSLGVVFFELLTGHHLYRLTIGTPVELEQVICQSEPPRPSRVVDKLQRPLHGDLDHIALKALRKEPEQRYRSVAELSEDIRRHLAGLPVAARRGTLRYRAEKFVRRHKTEVGASGLLLLAAIAGAIAVHRNGLAVRQRLDARDAAGGQRSAAAAAPAMLAVLPFENLGRPEDEYVADGITDEVRDKLIALPGVQVIARSSSAQYKKTNKPAPQISRELGARYLLSATVRWERSPPGERRVRVSPELIEVANGQTPTTKWAEPFDAPWSNLFQVQTDIALRVARALGLALGAGVRQQLAERPTRNLAAYEAFLRAEAAKQASDPVALRRALPYYQQAVALDSGFVLAWEQLARAHSIMYANGTPSPADAEAARNAAEHALALAPNRPEGHLARGLYYGAVVGDHAHALQEYTEASRLAPGDAQPLFPMATDEMSLGRWDAALDHLRRAEQLDPRSSQAPWAMGYALLWLRRSPEAAQAFDRGLALAPDRASLVAGKIMAALAQGDLAGARDILRSAPKEVDPAALVALVTQYYELEWVLEDAQRTLLLRLTPADFDGDRGVWGLIFARTYALQGDQARARAYADSARRTFEEQLRAAPDNPDRHAFLGLTLAYLGRKEPAIREGQRAVALLPLTKDAYVGPDIQRQLARIYMLVGEPEKALDRLEPLLRIPYYLSPNWLRIDPTFGPLRGNPRFERLLTGS
jgi:TolB-like protein/Tfp pilus assembly protein PilF/tRNA A-37 threonylcarbamoyl transferase component Bud32